MSMALGRIVALYAVVSLAGCGDDSEELVDGLFTEAEWSLIGGLSPLGDVPTDTTNAFADDPAAATLGQKLFFDARAAGPLIVGDDGSNGGLGTVGTFALVRCASCHNTDDGWFQDRRSNPPATSLGVDFGGRNAPPVVNSAFYRWFKWAGGADSMWAQALGTTESSKSHGSSRAAIAYMLNQYRAEYDAIFPVALDAEFGDTVTGRFPATGKPGDTAYDVLGDSDKEIVTRAFVNYAKAISAYQRLLVSRNAPFDQYVAGDFAAISAGAKRGLKTFVGKAGCVECHKTPLFSDNDFHNIGVPQEGEFVSATDTGRFGAVAKLIASSFNSDGAFSDDNTTGRLDNVSQREELRGQFRTKHLRQITETSPYMHTGQFETLTEVVEHYNVGGAESGFDGRKDDLLVPLNLTTDEIADIVEFLGTLTGDPVPSELLEDTSLPLP